MRRGAPGMLVVAVLALSAPAEATTAPPSPQRCGTSPAITIRVARGAVSCARAIRVMRLYHDSGSPQGWKCREARGAEQWQAQCRRIVGRAPRGLIYEYVNPSVAGPEG